MLLTRSADGSTTVTATSWYRLFVRPGFYFDWWTADITRHTRPGASLVVCATDDPLDLEVPRGKQDCQETSHAIWYPRTTGIWKTVWAAPCLLLQEKDETSLDR